MNCSSETSNVNLTSVCVAVGESQVHRFIGQIRLRYVSYPSHSPNVSRMYVAQLRIINHSSLLGYRAWNLSNVLFSGLPFPCNLVHKVLTLALICTQVYRQTLLH